MKKDREKKEKFPTPLKIPQTTIIKKDSQYDQQSEHELNANGNNFIGGSD